MDGDVSTLKCLITAKIHAVIEPLKQQIAKQQELITNQLSMIAIQLVESKDQNKAMNEAMTQLTQGMEKVAGHRHLFQVMEEKSRENSDSLTQMIKAIGKDQQAGHDRLSDGIGKLNQKHQQNHQLLQTVYQQIPKPPPLPPPQQPIQQPNQQLEQLSNQQIQQNLQYNHQQARHLLTKAAQTELTKAMQVEQQEVQEQNRFQQQQSQRQQPQQPYQHHTQIRQLSPHHQIQNNILQAQEDIARAQQSRHSDQPQLTKQSTQHQNPHQYATQSQTRQHNYAPHHQQKQQSSPESERRNQRQQNQERQHAEIGYDYDNNEGQQTTDRRIVMLMDSNRKNIDFTRLFPRADVEVRACSSIPAANKMLQMGFQQQSPTDIIIHVGTNDLDVMSAEAVSEGLQNLAVNASQKYRSARVHISTLLPRKDEIQARVVKVNRSAPAEIRQKVPGAHTILHAEINQKHLCDDKHLDRYMRDNARFSGTQLFSINLFRSVYGEDPAEWIVKSARRWKSKFTRQERNERYDRRGNGR